MSKSDASFVGVLIAVAICIYMLSRPDCKAGCRTVFQHLLDHELGLLF